MVFRFDLLTGKITEFVLSICQDKKSSSIFLRKKIEFSLNSTKNCSGQIKTFLTEFNQKVILMNFFLFFSFKGKNGKMLKFKLLHKYGSLVQKEEEKCHIVSFRQNS